MTSRVAVAGGRSSTAATLLIGGVILVASIVVATTIGPSSVGPADVWTTVLHKVGLSSDASDPISQAIVWDLRLPRVVLAALVGAGLALVGATMQSVTRNDLADPYLLGLSYGAALGAVVVLVLGVTVGVFGLAGAAFVGAMAAFGAVIAIAVSGYRLEPATTVLAGVAVAAICEAATSLIIVVAANPEQTRSVVYWLLGSLAGTRWSAVEIAAPVLAVCLVVLLAHARSLNALVFGDDDAGALGVSTTRLRWVLLTICALLTGVLVSQSGAIGFVGLLLPHGARILVGGDHRRLLPVAAIAGAIFLIWADTIARTLFAPVEIPVGVITALAGAPAFALLVRRRRRVL